MLPPAAPANPSQIHPAERLIAFLAVLILHVLRRDPLLRFMPPLRWMVERELRRLQRRIAEIAATPIPPRPAPDAPIAPLAPVAAPVAETGAAEPGFPGRPTAHASSRPRGQTRPTETGARAPASPRRPALRPAGPERARRFCATCRAARRFIVSPSPAPMRGRIARPPASPPTRKIARWPDLSPRAHFVTVSE